MKGTIVNFRMSRHRKSNNQMVLKVDGVDSKEKASALAGKKAVWKSPAGKEISGKITAAHGGKGCVRVIFETGMPGQAIASRVEIQ